MGILLKAVENGLAPDKVVRWGIRKLLKQRLEEISEKKDWHRDGILSQLNNSPIATATEEANEQHYEVPSDFYKIVLGDNLKYSSAFFEEGIIDLSKAEEKMLEIYLDRAKLRDGPLKILELGCGWGSLTLFMAKNLPQSHITAISNSQSQREFILQKAKDLNITNIEIITQDINFFDPKNSFDRIISIEMFEHVRNYSTLFSKMRRWLSPEGLLFLHIFCHKDSTYLFETEGEDNWMGKYFFTGGVMPSFDLFERVQSSFHLNQKWMVNGSHYEKTARGWLNNMDNNKEQVLKVLENAYGKKDATLWFQRWRIFFASCEELFGHNNGKEWFVGHFQFRPNAYDK